MFRILHDQYGHTRRVVSLFSLGFTILTGAVSTALAQTTYYVAASGSDNNSGRSADAPFQTLGKVNSLSLQAGDQVLFRRGDTFRGTLMIRQSGTSGQPIVIDAYGSGSKPVLAGSLPVTNWSSVGSNLWQASASGLGSRVTGVYRNGSALPLGRFPNLNASNRGYLTVSGHDGKTKLDSQDDLGSTNWTGGEVVYRAVQWIIERATINQQSGRTLYVTNLTKSIGNGDGYDIRDGWGFFIQNHPGTLDQSGEWYYNPSNKTIRLYSDTNPNGQTITATYSNEAVNLANVSNVTLRNLEVTQATGTNVLATSCSNLQLSSVDITNAGEDGLLINGSGSGIVFENGTIQDINNNGVNISAYQNVAFRGNTVQRIGLFPGRGKGGDGTYTGFQSASYSNTTIENNVFDQIGYNGINFANNTVIQRNRVSNYCLTKSDGGGIYIWNGNRQAMSGVRILKNLVFNGIGATEGSPGGAYSGANGIYLDDCTTNIEVADNSVFNCKGIGIYLHGSSSVRVTGNTSYNNGETQLYVQTIANACSPRNNVIQNNIFVSRPNDPSNTTNQLVAKYESNQEDLSSFGQFDYNVYARPFNDNNKIRMVGGGAGVDQGLPEWRSRSGGQDANSLNSPLTYSISNVAIDDVMRLEYNDSSQEKTVSLGGTYRDARNNVYNGQITIGAYSAVVLLKDIAASVPLRDPENPSNTASGLDYNYYEQTVSQVSDINGFTPTRTATASVADLSVQHRENSYALQFKGYINVPSNGVYTFYTNSDDGSKLYIGSTQVVDNDGGHGEQERSGTIGLKAGKHAITIPYFQGGGGQALSVSYSGPGVGKQTIPASAFFRVPGTTTNPPVSNNYRDPENPSNAVSGLDVNYYEQSVGQVSDINNLSPTRTTTASVVDLSPRSRDNNYALQFKGYINVPSDGVYTFYTNSDDGSKLYIGSTQVVDNDGGHAEQERSGTIGLKAGKHAITIPYFQGGGGQALSVSYSGPGVGKQTIPASAFFRVPGTTTNPPVSNNYRDPENPSNAVSGLDFSYYEQTVNQVAEIYNLTPLRTGTASQMDLSPMHRDDGFALLYKGYINVPSDGVYTFYTNSDDGSKLYIGSTQVVDNDGGHAEQERSGTIGLKAGKHAISLPYFEGGGGQTLSVSYSGPGVGKQTIPASAFFRVPGTTTTNPPVSNNYRDPENPSNTVNGLDYTYYEGSWGQLPNFDAMSPQRSGTSSVADLSPQQRDDNFGIQYKGYISVPTDGVYTFYTNSDDGSKLYIGSTQVVDNDGGHAEQERSGTIGLKAGKHAITIPYFEGGGGQTLSVSYSGPGVGKQTIPASAFFRVPSTTTTPPTTTGNGTGLRGEYFNNKSLTSPSTMTRTDPTINFDWGNNSPASGMNVDNFSVRWLGQVAAPVSGNYVFATTGDDGMRLWINNNLVIDNWQVQASTTRTSPEIALVAGQKYDIRVEYFEQDGGATAKLMWTYPGQGQQVIPQVQLFPASANGRQNAEAKLGSAAQTAEALPGAQVFPIPARDELKVRFYAPEAGEATLQLTSLTGVSVLQETHSHQAGDHTVTLSVRQLSRGYYLLTLLHNGQRTVKKVLLTD